MRWRCNADEVMCDACGTLALVHLGRVPEGWTQTIERPPEATNHHPRSKESLWNLCKACKPAPKPIPFPQMVETV